MLKRIDFLQWIAAACFMGIVGVITAVIVQSIQENRLPEDRLDYKIQGSKDLKHLQWQLKMIDAKLDRLQPQRGECE